MKILFKGDSTFDIELNYSSKMGFFDWCTSQSADITNSIRGFVNSRGAKFSPNDNEISSTNTIPSSRWGSGHLDIHYKGALITSESDASAKVKEILDKINQYTGNVRGYNYFLFKVAKMPNGEFETRVLSNVNQEPLVPFSQTPVASFIIRFVFPEAGKPFYFQGSSQDSWYSAIEINLLQNDEAFLKWTIYVSFYGGSGNKTRTEILTGTRGYQYFRNFAVWLKIEEQQSLSIAQAKTLLRKVELYQQVREMEEFLPHDDEQFIKW